MGKDARNYYEEIDRAIKSYESNRTWHEKTISWICDRIDWCHKWHKITEEETHELCTRIVDIMENEE